MYIDKPIIFMMLLFMLIACTISGFFVIKDSYDKFHPVYIFIGLCLVGASTFVSSIVSKFMFWLTKG